MFRLFKRLAAIPTVVVAPTSTALSDFKRAPQINPEFLKLQDKLFSLGLMVEDEVMELPRLLAKIEAASGEFSYEYTRKLGKPVEAIIKDVCCDVKHMPSKLDIGMDVLYECCYWVEMLQHKSLPSYYPRPTIPAGIPSREIANPMTQLRYVIDEHKSGRLSWRSVMASILDLHAELSLKRC